MYNYPHYKENDKARLLDFMRTHPFVTMIGTNKAGRIELTQIPVMVEEKQDKIYLYGHIARKSDHHEAFEENSEVLVLFTSPHAYVSGSWYAGNPQQASTWNYISIHARGKMHFTDEEALKTLLKKLTLHFENGNTGSSTIYDNLPPDYVSKLIKAIIAFEIEVKEIDNVFKLSQNRDRKSYENIIAQLENQDEAGKYIAGRMKENASQLFKDK